MLKITILCITLLFGTINAATAAADKDRFLLVYVLQEMVYAKPGDAVLDHFYAGKRVISDWGGAMGDDPWSADLTIGELVLRNDEKKSLLLASGDGLMIRFEFGGSGSGGYFRYVSRGLPVDYAYLQYWKKIGDKFALVHIVGRELAAVEKARDIVAGIGVRHGELRRDGKLDQSLVAKINAAVPR